MTLRKKFTLIFLLLALPMEIGLVSFILSHFQTSTEQQIQSVANTHLQALSHFSSEFFKSEKQDQIAPLLASYCNKNPNLEYAYFKSNDGVILHHSFKDKLPDSFREKKIVSDIHFDENPTRDFSYPLNDKINLVVGLDTTSYKVGYNSFTTIFILLSLLALFPGFFITGFITTKNISTPIDNLLNITQKIGAGNFDKRIEIDSEDEFAQLGESFNQMIDELTVPRKKVEETQKSLKFLLNMSRSLSSTLNLHQVLEQLSDILLQSMLHTNCRIALFDESRTSLIVEIDKAVSGNNSSSQEKERLSMNSFVHYIQLMGDEDIKILRLNDPNLNLNIHERKFFFLNDLQSVLFISLKSQGIALGCVMLGEKRNWKRSPFTKDKIDFCMTLVNQATAAIENARLYRDMHNIYLNTITSLAETLDARDPYTLDHSKAVTRYALLIARSMGLDSKEQDTIRNAGLLHDIGKIAIPDQILHKPGKLSSQEFELIKEHPFRGAKILEPIKEFHNLIPLIAHHHERYDGKGYNAQLKGENIPVGARIMTIADSFHAMISDRPYRKGMSFDRAIGELVRWRGTQFDPEMTDIFVKYIPQSQLYIPQLQKLVFA